jgi:hypothetical protein
VVMAIDHFVDKDDMDRFCSILRIQCSNHHFWRR